ncbi:hypothetical protein GGU10DRAFT_395390 [Lentinula aff. detonsa]|uniref:Sjogrens syndrome scleroderma autoantigen 1 family protein n=1 Tax=Lentinula aff. detonsa TaxID=2804958 RepID=A0AA38NPI6_9AGAR|nr:hypothetical protein GGU10DRAFT_395390 [Lentinula aff. detonsa]
MSTVTDVSNIIGEYMLKGWILTDSPCPQCKNIPLMRSPKNQTPTVHFCANCDGDAQRSGNSSLLSFHHSLHLSKMYTVVQTSTSPSLTSNSSISPRNTHSRSSTPATEISDVPSSPTFSIPAETPESRRRREQSDRASSEIGNRLLKGWALLGEECVNEDCFGIPLVRPPKSSGENQRVRLQSHKECVICGRLYVGEGELVEAELPRSSALQSSNQNLPMRTDISSSNVSGATKLTFELLQPTGTMLHPTTSPNDESTISALNITTHALEQTLISLSGRLTSSAGSSILVDPHTISSIVDTISKTTQALAEVKKLKQVERAGI